MSRHLYVVMGDLYSAVDLVHLDKGSSVEEEVEAGLSHRRLRPIVISMAANKG